MKEFKVNPLNVVKSRRLECLLPHMNPVPVNFLSLYRFDCFTWIEINLKGRYWHGSLTKLVDNKLTTSDYIAFEDSYETTLFLLGCPHLAKNKVGF